MQTRCRYPLWVLSNFLAPLLPLLACFPHLHNQVWQLLKLARCWGKGCLIGKEDSTEDYSNKEERPEHSLRLTAETKNWRAFKSKDGGKYQALCVC